MDLLKDKIKMKWKVEEKNGKWRIVFTEFPKELRGNIQSTVVGNVRVASAGCVDFYYVSVNELYIFLPGSGSDVVYNRSTWHEDFDLKNKVINVLKLITKNDLKITRRRI